MPKKLTDWHKERALTYLRENRGLHPEDIDHVRKTWAALARLAATVPA